MRKFTVGDRVYIGKVFHSGRDIPDFMPSYLYPIVSIGNGVVDGPIDFNHWVDLGGKLIPFAPEELLTQEEGPYKDPQLPLPLEYDVTKAVPKETSKLLDQLIPKGDCPCTDDKLGYPLTPEEACKLAEEGLKVHIDDFQVKDSGKRVQFDSGMVRDVADDKIDYSLVFDGPMFQRWAEHLTKGAKKYTKRNWMQAAGQAEADRFRESALRHFVQWYYGKNDEDHGSAVFFNINGFEYVKSRGATK